MATFLTNFNQLGAINLTTANTATVCYTYSTSTVDSVQLNSVRIVNRDTGYISVRAWALNSNISATVTSALVWDAPIPPGSWLELCDTKIIALSGASATVQVLVNTASVCNVLVSGMEIIS